MSGLLPDTALQIAEQEETSSINIVATAPQYKRTFVFDFETGEFVLDTTNRVRSATQEKDILVQIVDKILHDPRYKRLAYSSSYGNEVDALIQQDFHREIFESEYKRVITEGLIYHPLIEEVRNFVFSGELDTLYCEFTVVGVKGVTIQRREEVRF